MLPPEFLEGEVKVESRRLIAPGLLHRPLGDGPGLGALALATHGFKLRLVPQKKGDTDVQTGDAGHTVLHIGRDVERHDHGEPNLTWEDKRRNFISPGPVDGPCSSIILG